MTRPGLLVAALLLVVGCAGGPQPRPDAALLRKQVAQALIAKRNWAGVTRPLQRLAADRPGDPDLHAMLGTVYREQGLHDEAEAAFQTALQLDPRHAEAWNGLGMLRDVRHDAGDGAVEAFRKAVAIAPNHPTYYNNLGVALFRRGQDLPALEAFRKGLQRDPGVRRIRNNLGFTYGRLGHYQLAKREFYRAGPPGEAENNLGWVYELGGDPETACTCYREAARLEPTLVVVQSNLTRACAAAAAIERERGGVETAQLPVPPPKAASVTPRVAAKRRMP